MAKSGVDKGDNEAYEYDAAGNTTKQTIGATTSTMTYDRNRLTKTVTGSTTVNQRYDIFGRATTSDVGAQVVEQNAYDGYDRLTRQQKFDTAGTATYTRNQSYDPFDRVTNQSEKVGAAQSISTRYTFGGLANQVTAEEEQDTAGTWKTSKSYAYGANGENLSLTDSPVNGTTSKKSFYSTNPHGDVETLTDSTGSTTSTYRYTAYGQPDKTGTTGDDAITGNANQDADVVNPYRFNSKRFDGAAGTYDMGFREYNPGLNRYLTRDYYNGALNDLALGTDPWNANRYAFAGGNPVTGIELDGHIAIDENGDQYVPTPQPPAKAPTTVDPALQPLVDGEYARPGVTKVVGDGRTTTALRNELETGAKTGTGTTATYHLQKVLEQANGYANALRKSDVDRFHGRPGLAEADEILLRRLFRDSWDALTMEDQAKAVTADLDSRGIRADVDSAIDRLVKNQAVSGETGAQFAEQHPRAYAQTFRGSGGSVFLGRTLTVLSLIGDAQYAWEAGRIFSGKQPNCGLLPAPLTQYGCPAPVS